MIKMMNSLFKNHRPTKVFILMSFLFVAYPSCTKYDLIQIDNATTLLPTLSAYKIFKGDPTDLMPSDGFQLYELATPLFTDYAEKQRLIKLPSGTHLKSLGDGLPEFPDETILVKTFYYFKDKRKPNLGKRLIETRILIKTEGKWSVGTYLWNDLQTEAILQTMGSNQNVNWTDETGLSKNINYHIPSPIECTTCHQSAHTILPIGTKLRNMNRDVQRNGLNINQLEYLKNADILETLNTSNITKLPNWQNSSIKISDRARAYFDINCAHCHNKQGYSAETKLFFDFETTIDNSKIVDKKKSIISKMSASNSKDRMPKLGTTVIDEKGLELIKSYINSL
jgi:uncharacterized repeat protein (TIGR03806 family)